MTTTFGPIRSGAARFRCACSVAYNDGSVEWQAPGKDHAIVQVAEQVGRVRERGHTVNSATVTTAGGAIYDVLALLED